MNATARELLDLNEAADLLGISPRHLWTLARKRHEIPYVMLGRRLKFSRLQLLRWLDEQAGITANDEPEAETA